MKKLAYLLILVPLLVGGWIVKDRATFDRAAWLADYQQLRSAVEQQYANLKWSRSSKNVDLVALNESALEQLQQATTHSAARRALVNFISGFRDAHFHIESGPPQPIAAVLGVFQREDDTVIELSMAAEEACSALGFKKTSHKLAIDGVNQLANSTFAAGTIKSTTGRTFGIIRIPLFRQHEYAAVCHRAWQSFSGARVGPCDEDCQYEFNNIAKHELAQALADDATTLRQLGAEAVIIDLTGNGGGTEWAENAAAALTNRKLQSPGTAFVRGPHWEKSFSEVIANLDAVLKQSPHHPLRDLVIEGRDVAAAMRDSARTSCDLSGLWSERSLQPSCWNIVTNVPSPLPGEDTDYVRPYGGPLYIMTDPHTASASEQFAATLRDNAVAQTIGEPTMGIGCGYTNGGNPIMLKNSGIVVWMPDCVRLRRDGSNEFEGVKPDYPVEWGEDRASRSRALVSALDKLPKR
ncbi:MAG TPA: S41 family peptidase [Longimicrobiales bacterium]